MGLRTPNTPQILTVILSTGKKLLQPFAPANSNLTQTQPARTFQHKTPVIVLKQWSLNVKQFYLKKEEKKLSTGAWLAVWHALAYFLFDLHKSGRNFYPLFTNKTGGSEI